MSRERPILFSDRLVQAILDGRKTETRRVVKNGPPGLEMPCPYGLAGDTLWVREAHYIHPNHVVWPGLPHRRGPNGEAAFYRTGFDRAFSGRWRPSIHMPRWASRLTLRVTEVRAERLQEITADGARAEGCPDRPVEGAEQASVDALARWWVQELWDKIYQPKGLGWEANPWVWVVAFEVLA